ncbi:MAG: transglycosylase family protein [Aquihabitans sp.]
MNKATTRAERDAQPPSTSGTSTRRARLWPLAVAVVAIGLVTAAAQVSAADPIADAVATTAQRTSSEAPVARPAKAVAETPDDSVFAALGDITLVGAATAATAANDIDVTPPPPPPTTTTTTTTTAPPAPAPAPAPVAEQGTGRCGGDLPPCYVMMRESGGNIRARNPSSSASGKWQFIRSTWAGYGGYSDAYLAPESVQDAKARELWAGGAGCGHWNAC